MPSLLKERRVPNRLVEDGVGDRLRRVCRCRFDNAERGRVVDAVGGEWCNGGDDGDRPPQGSLVGGGAKHEREAGGGL